MNTEMYNSLFDLSQEQLDMVNKISNDYPITGVDTLVFMTISNGNQDELIKMIEQYCLTGNLDIAIAKHYHSKNFYMESHPSKRLIQ